MNIRELLLEGKNRLSQPVPSCSIDNPSLDSSLLLGRVLNCSKEKLIANGGETVYPSQIEQFHLLLERRQKGECIAYILDRKEFSGLEFFVNPDVLVPRPETEFLVEAALKAGDLAAKSSNKQITLLDLCTGSGAIAVSIKTKRPVWGIFASDISVAALEIAKKNAEQLLPDASGINFIKSDLFGSIQLSFDIIVSNPPYVASLEIEKLSPEVRREPVLALDGGKDGLDIIRRIINEAPKYLQPDGKLILEADPRQMETINNIFLDNGFENILTTKDLSGSERIIEGACKILYSLR